MGHTRTLTLIGLLLLTAALYSPLRSASFVFEDAKAVIQAPEWSMPGRGMSQWTWQAIGPKPDIAHLVNVGLHLVNGGLVAALGTALAGPTVGVVAAGVLLLHPLSSEAVSYVTGRADLLVTLFVLLSVWLAVRWSQDGGAWRLGIAGASLVLASMSKEIGLIGVPLVAWTVIAFRGRLPQSPAFLQALWLGLGLTVGFTWHRISGWIAMSSDNGGSLFAWPEFVGLQLVAVWRLLMLTVWPVGFTIDPDIVGMADRHVAAGIRTLAAAILGVWAWKRAPLTTWALGWVAICVAPRFIFATNEFLKEYQFVTAWAGLSVLCAVALVGACPSPAPVWRERTA